MALSLAKANWPCNASTPAGRAPSLAKKSVAILVFPGTVKAGLVIGAPTGDGILFENNAQKADYNISSASFGLQAGAQSFAYVLFLMNRAAVAYLNKGDGLSIAPAPAS